MTELKLSRRANHRLAVLRRVEEASGSVAAPARTTMTRCCPKGLPGLRANRPASLSTSCHDQMHGVAPAAAGALVTPKA